MLVPIAANLANGLYFCLDLGCTVLFTYCLSTIVTAWHAKKLYLTQSGVVLCPSRLYALSEHGATSKTTHMLIALFTVLATTLLALGDLSMAGVTTLRTEDVRVEYVVTRVQGNSSFDLTNGQSVNAKNVTGAFLMLRPMLSCRSPISKGFNLAAYYHREVNSSLLESRFEWQQLPGFSSPFKNIACLSEQNGFLEGSRMFQFFQDEDPDGKPCGFSESSLKSIVLYMTSNNVQPGVPVQVQGLSTEICMHKIDEMWCIYTQDLYCAAKLVSLTGNEHILLIRNCRSRSTCKIETGAHYINGLLDYPALKSIAFLLSVPKLAFLGPLELILLPWLTVKRAKTVQLGKPQNVTEVNILFFVLTTGTALLLTLTTALAALFMWVKYLYLPNLRERNCFNSAEELLSAAADIAFTGSVTMHRRKNVRVGMWSDLPHTGPVPEAE